MIYIFWEEYLKQWTHYALLQLHLKIGEVLVPKMLSKMLIPNTSLWLLHCFTFAIASVFSFFFILENGGGISSWFYCEYKYMDFSPIL